MCSKVNIRIRVIPSQSPHHPPRRPDPPTLPTYTKSFSDLRQVSASILAAIYELVLSQHSDSSAPANPLTQDWNSPTQDSMSAIAACALHTSLLRIPPGTLHRRAHRLTEPSSRSHTGNLATLQT
ncbi:hypothetical protein BV22DRAFT_1134061 [Leucogyrophana mollusca]|uniref:Uncharacterized protein n=1 Tax=Leucogyrophana mollusca TaxID=85980 RepID=A0ACB8B0U9_9AGAM|nr:hypothetical protein BV22DRAFT_1134061 [Leucogyrophana mollusca]